MEILCGVALMAQGTYRIRCFHCRLLRTEPTQLCSRCGALSILCWGCNQERVDPVQPCPNCEAVDTLYIPPPSSYTRRIWWSGVRGIQRQIRDQRRANRRLAPPLPLDRALARVDRYLVGPGHLPSAFTQDIRDAFNI